MLHQFALDVQTGCPGLYKIVILESVKMLKKTIIYLLLSQFVLVYVHASSVLSLNFEQLSSHSEVIFYGRCISNQVEQDPETKLIVTFTTFEILTPVKGTQGLTHTIKQLGGDLAESNIQTKWPAIPKFIIGNEYVVFLPAVSSLGFSTPVGLEQGKFKVIADILGKQVNNGKSFDALLKNIPEKKLPPSILNRIKAPSITQNLNTSAGSAQTKNISLDDLLNIVQSIEAAK